jgi:predicted nuclease with TOPRIM domain
MSDNTEIKVDIESLKKDVENVNNIQGRLDTAIDKLTDVSTSIKSMLAVHEEKIERSEKIDEVIFEKLKDRAEALTDVYRELKKDIEMTEKRLLIEVKSLKNDINARVGVLERYKWIILGGSIVIGFILSKNFATIIRMLSN